MRRIEFSTFSGGATEWQAGLASLDARMAALQQSYLYGEIARAAGRSVARYRLTRGGRLVGQVQMIGRSGLWLVSRGPVFSEEVAPRDRRACLRRLAHRFGILLATPETACPGPGVIPLISARHHAIWDVAAAPEILRDAMAGKWRNRLSAAERAGLRVLEEPGIDWILAADADQQSQRGYRALPADFTRQWAQRAPRDLLALRVETACGARLAGGIFLRHGLGASYHIGWTGEEGRGCGAHNLMLWQAATRLRALGVNRLDLGAVDSEEGSGRMRFKLGTGARVATLGPSSWVLPG